MGREDILKKVMDALRMFAEDPAALDNAHIDSQLKDDLGIDSAHMIDAILALEDLFSVREIEDPEVAKMKIVRDVVDAIDIRLGSG